MYVIMPIEFTCTDGKIIEEEIRVNLSQISLRRNITEDRHYVIVSGVSSKGELMEVDLTKDRWLTLWDYMYEVNKVQGYGDIGKEVQIDSEPVGSNLEGIEL